MTNPSATRKSSTLVDLRSLLSSISDTTLLADPALSALMVEYACWKAHLANWQDRQPPKRYCDYDGWICEGRALFDRRDELKQLAYALLRPA